MESPHWWRWAHWAPYWRDLWQEAKRHKLGEGFVIAALTVGVALVVGANGSPWAHEQAMGICFNAGVVLIAVAIVAVFVFLVIAPARIHRRLRTDLTILRCENATLKGDDTGTKRFYDLRCELAYLTFSGEADADQQAVALRKFLRCV